MFVWIGAAIGSLICLIGGTLSDKFGGARVIIVAIIVCSTAAITQGIILIKTHELEQPEKNFFAFLFLFLLLFQCTRTMNGSTFYTIKVLFPAE